MYFCKKHKIMNNKVSKEKRRDNVICFTVNIDEQFEIRKTAISEGVSLSDYCKNKVLVKETNIVPKLASNSNVTYKEGGNVALEMEVGVKNTIIKKLEAELKEARDKYKSMLDDRNAVANRHNETIKELDVAEAEIKSIKALYENSFTKDEILTAHKNYFEKMSIEFDEVARLIEPNQFLKNPITQDKAVRGAMQFIKKYPKTAEFTIQKSAVVL